MARIHAHLSLGLLACCAGIAFASHALDNGELPENQSCKAVSQRDEPRLNLRIEQALGETITTCAVRATAYIQTRAPIDRIEATLTVKPLAGPAKSDRIGIAFEPLRTGMKSGEFTADAISAPLCRGVQVSAKIGACFEAAGDEKPCPEVRIVGADAFGRVEVTNPGSTVCYD